MAVEVSVLLQRRESLTLQFRFGSIESMPGTGRKFRDQRRHDTYYMRAQAEGYRSRAAYKLKFINERFDVLRPGDVVVDLGAAPGGWSQVASELVGRRGIVIAVDIRKMDPLQGVRFVRGDFTKADTRKRVLDACGSANRADAVISDMSPKISGNYSLDHAKSIDLAEAALAFAVDVLRQGGCFVCKVFEGDMYRTYIRKVQGFFEDSRGFRSKASRDSSSEIYVVAKGQRVIR